MYIYHTIVLTPTKNDILIMTYKWNSAEAKSYADAFSSLICNEFFNQQSSIGGKEILGISEIKQLNMLVIKNLYDKWQEENRRLKSPFFDYEEPEVKEALATLMNTLSRNISVKKDAFQNLLSKATYDTIQLALKPEEYFENQLRNLPDFKLTERWIQDNGKYFLINKHILDALSQKLGNNEVFANKAIEWLEEILVNERVEDGNDLISDFNKIHPVPFGERNGKASFFEEIMSQPTAVREKVALKPTEEEPAIASYVTKEKVTPQEPAPAKRPSSEPIRLNDRHEGTALTLNERIIAENTKSLLDIHQKKKISSLKEGISFNQRFLFIRNLFGGDQDAFTQSLEALETFPNYEEAKKHIEKNISNHYKWNEYSHETEEFYAHLERKFA